MTSTKDDWSTTTLISKTSKFRNNVITSTKLPKTILQNRAFASENHRIISQNNNFFNKISNFFKLI